MIYTDLTRLAMKIAYNKHHNQLDKAGIPYIYHPIHIAEQMHSEETTCVALLHDVIEDTDTTIDDLRSAHFPESVLSALELMTHTSEVPYLEYVQRIKTNPIARAVKIADLKHNSDLTRFSEEPNEKALRRIEKYSKALAILSE